MAGIGAKVAVAAGVVGGVVAVHSWWIGEAVEQRLRATVASAGEQTGYRIALERYDRGVFTSEAETLVEVPLPPASSEELRRLLPPSLRLRMLHRISHGPGLDGLRSARMLSTPSFDGEELAGLREIYGDKAPFSVQTDFGYGDDATVELRSPAVHTKVAGAAGTVELEWDGVEGDFTVRGGALSGRVFAPKLLLRGDTANFGLSALSWTMDLRRSRPAGFWTGDAELRAASLDLSVPAARLHLQRPSLATRTAQDAGLATSSGAVTADRIEWAGGAADRPALRVRVDRLDGEALARIAEVLQRRTAPPAATLAELDAALAEVRPMVERVALQRPEMRIDEISLRLPQGELRASGKVRYVGDAVLADFAPADLESDAVLELPAAWLDLALSQLALVQALAAEPAASAPPDPAALERWAAMLRERWRADYFEIVGDRARCRFEMKEGRLLYNGRSVGPPA